jgi:hypothetical protein
MQVQGSLISIKMSLCNKDKEGGEGAFCCLSCFFFVGSALLPIFFSKFFSKRTFTLCVRVL